MGLRLVLGRAGSGKSTFCLREIAAEQAARPTGFPLIFIVPEQATFQAEYALATRGGLGGAMRAQVLSFRRLAWKVMQESGGGKRLFIDDTGKGMLLRRILEKCKGELTVFRHSGEQSGLLDNLVQFYNEMKRACLDVSLLREALGKHAACGDVVSEGNAALGNAAAGETASDDAKAGDVAPGGATPGDTVAGDAAGGDATARDRVAGEVIAGDTVTGKGLPSLFKRKLNDLILILEKAEDELAAHYIDAEDYLNLLALQLPAFSFFKGAEVWVDGFYGFTAQEYRVLEELFMLCRRVTVTVCTERDCAPGEKVDELDPFYPAAVTCRRLQQLAQDRTVPLEKVFLGGLKWQGEGALDRAESPKEQVFPGRLGQVCPGVAERLLGKELREPKHSYEGAPLGSAGQPLEKAFPDGTEQSLERIVGREKYPVNPGGVEQPLEKAFLGGEGLPRFEGRPDLAYLERNVQNYPGKPFEGEVAALRLAAALNRRCEVESLAREIIGLVRDGGCRWRDMVVTLCNPDEYRDIIATVFTDYGIPFFQDQKRSVIHHPLVEFIRSALEVVNRNWRYEAVFRCIKTEFLFPRECVAGPGAGLVPGAVPARNWREKADRLENYVLAYGIRGAASWLQERPWEYRRRDTLEEAGAGEERLTGGEKAFLQLVNDARFVLSAPLARFEKKFRGAQTVKEKTAALYELLVDTDVEGRLELWGQEALPENGPEKAREHQQVYKGIVAVMDQLVELMGAETISAELYAGIVDAGLEALRLSLVPPSLDQVFVGDVERSRPGPAHYVFLLGVNDGVLPSRPREDGIFSEEEREAISGWGLEIAPGNRRRLLDEQFLIYMALTRASRGLWVSYPLADEEGRALVPSLLIAHLKELFPALPEELLVAEPEPGEGGGKAATACYGGGGAGDISSAGDTVNADGINSANQLSNANNVSDINDLNDGLNSANETGYLSDPTAAYLLQYIAHPRRALSHLAVQLSRWKKGEEIQPLWWEVYNWFAREESWRHLAGRLLGGIFYDNRESPLVAETSLQIYGDEPRVSVSRLERFQACPFSHFISYGLRLQERQIYRLESLDIGRFFHAALRNFALTLQEKGLDWGELDQESCLQLAATEVNDLLPRLQEEILLSSSRYRYLGEKLKETVGRTVLILGEQARYSNFRPVGLELSFGPGGDLPGMAFTLENGGRVELAGRIDRVDRAVDKGGQAYLRVIDYKSGQTALRLPEVFYGLTLQVLVYLDIVLSHAGAWLKEPALPAGVLYFRVHTPLISSSTLLTPEQVAQQIRKCYKMQGLVLEDRDIVRLMDNSLQNGYSEIVPVGLKVDGNFYKGSAIASEERFAQLLEHVRRVIREAAGKITGGQVMISPYRLGKKSACTYCPYKAICQFDTTLEGNSYRLLKSLETERIWGYLEKSEGTKPGG